MMPLSVVVLDTGGHVVAMKREDGSGIMRNEIAIGKAYVCEPLVQKFFTAAV